MKMKGASIQRQYYLTLTFFKAQVLFNYSEIRFIWNTISMQNDGEKWKHSTLVSFQPSLFYGLSWSRLLKNWVHFKQTLVKNRNETWNYSTVVLLNSHCFYGSMCVQALNTSTNHFHFEAKVCVKWIQILYNLLQIKFKKMRVEIFALNTSIFHFCFESNVYFKSIRFMSTSIIQPSLFYGSICIQLLINEVIWNTISEQNEG